MAGPSRPCASACGCVAPLILFSLLFSAAALSPDDVDNEPGFVFDDPDSERWTPGPPGRNMVDRFDGTFEVHGRVQGVWLASTQQQAELHALAGCKTQFAALLWVRRVAASGQARSARMAQARA